MEANLDEIITILATPIALRTQKMIQVLMTLTKTISFFDKLIKELGENLHYRTCEFLSGEFQLADTVKSMQVLFNEGDQGEKFYIILRGRVKLFIKNRFSKDSEMIAIATLNSGHSFGELSLIKNQPRTATVVCMENSHFMILSKEDYNRLLGRSFLKKLEERIEYLHSLKIFHNWTKKSLERITYHFKTVEFKQGDVIYSKGDVSENAYFIINGDIELTVKNSFRGSEDFPRVLKVALIAEKDIFGDEEILLRVNRKYTATCVSKTASLLSISNEDFLGKINKESLMQLVMRNFTRNSLREGRLKSVEKFKEDKRPASVVPRKDKRPALVVSGNKKMSPNSPSLIRVATPKQTTHMPTRNLCVSTYMINSLKKKSFLDTSSPTASIMENCVVVNRVKSKNVFVNVKGFQPFSKISCGIFQKINDRRKNLEIV